MKSAHEKPQITIRPISEGLGLGTLRAKTHQVRTAASSVQGVDASAPQMVDIKRNAHLAYAPHSVATQVRQRKTTRFYVSFWRFFAGVGADIFVGSISIFVLSWAGVLAWNAGSTGEFNPLDALLVITDVLEKFSALRVSLAVVLLALFWRSSKILLEPRVSN